MFKLLCRRHLSRRPPATPDPIIRPVLRRAYKKGLFLKEGCLEIKGAFGKFINHEFGVKHAERDPQKFSYLVIKGALGKSFNTPRIATK